MFVKPPGITSIVSRFKGMKIRPSTCMEFKNAAISYLKMLANTRTLRIPTPTYIIDLVKDPSLIYVEVSKSRK